MVSFRGPAVGAEGQQGQSIVLLALALVMIIGMAAIGIDGSLNLVDRRALQRAADAGALSGAGAVAQGPAIAQTTAMQYTFQNLGLSWGSTCSGASDCTVGPLGGFTVIVKNPYNPKNGLANPHVDPAASVSVDISHSKAQSGFAAVTGVSSVPIAAHAAATSQSGGQNYSVALATRLLQVQGSTPEGVYGAVLVAQCNDNGTGGFGINGGQNGGLFINGSAELDLGSSLDSSTGTKIYQSAQGIIAANKDTRGPTCTGGTANQDPLTTAAGLQDHVLLDPAASDYNFAYGFNSGPPGCKLAASLTCQTNPVGDGGWQDKPCWSTGFSNQIKATTGFYDASTNTITPGLATPCTQLTNGNTYEGSFADSQLKGLPPFPEPFLIINTNDPNETIPPDTKSAKTGIIPATGNILFQRPPNAIVYTSWGGTKGKGDLIFEPGWYVFDGIGGAFTVSPNTFQCQGPGGITATTAFNGCVFIFRNGASLKISGGALQCSPSVPGHLGCSFEFSDSATAKATMALSNKVNVSLSPIAYPPQALSNCQAQPLVMGSSCMPIVWSSDNNNCFIGANGPCAVDLAQSGSTFAVGGTIYAPNGIYSANANAAPSSGQVIADTVVLQGGNSTAGSGVAYQGSVVSPIPGASFLFE